MTSPSPGLDTGILIVGAGPIGLFLATECARRGLPFRIVEQNAGQSTHSKALAIFPRTLEIFDMAGLVAPFLEKANRVTTVALASHDKNLARMPFDPAGTPYPFIAMVPQNVTEALLVEELHKRGGRVEYESSFLSAEQNSDGVTVSLQTRNGPSQVQAAFIAGCDGAHSKVREALNLPLEGGEYRGAFMLADMETNEFSPPTELDLCPNENGPVALFPISATRWRMVATVDDPQGEAPDLALVQRLLRDRTPFQAEARSLLWSSYFHIHHRHAPRLRDRRIFIAGDAAHVHSPFGGQGMNTGLHDAWNLIWKLDLALRGHANQTLLDSYAAERLPVIRDVIETTDRLTRALGTASRLAQAIRDTLIPAASHLEFVQHAFVRNLSGLGVAYHGSPIVEGSGARWFGDSLRGGSAIRSRFLLHIGEDAPPAVTEQAAHLAQSFSPAVELRSTANPGAQLIRPDGYLAFASSSADHHALATIGSLLERQTR